MLDTQDTLQARFHQLSDEELLHRYAQGKLSEAAQAIAADELTGRGLALPAMTEAGPADEPVGEYHGDLINVARYLDSTEAHLLKAYLESFAIPAHVADANLIQAGPFLGDATGCTSLRVPADFVAEARELIEKFNRGEFATTDEPGEASDDAKGAPEPADAATGEKTFRVYSHPGQAVPIVVKVGFSWAAFFFGPLWFLVNYMWLNAVLAGALVIGGKLYFPYHHPAGGLGTLLFLSMNTLYIVAWIAMAWFANGLLAGELEGRGYRLLATVKARNSTYARAAAISQTTEPPGRNAAP